MSLAMSMGSRSVLRQGWLGTRRMLHGSAVARASSGGAMPPEEFNEMQGLPFQYHPDNIYADMDNDGTTRTFLCGYLVLIPTGIFMAYFVDRPTLVDWAREEALDREAKARIAARQAREDARIEAEAAEAAQEI